MFKCVVGLRFVVMYTTTTVSLYIFLALVCIHVAV